MTLRGKKESGAPSSWWLSTRPVNRSVSAERGWLEEPQPERDHKPSHALKWYKMMGAADLPPESRDDPAQ